MSVISKAASAAAILYGLSAANAVAQDTQVLPSIEVDSDDLPAGPVSSETLSRDRIAPLQSGTSDTTAVISRLPGVRRSEESRVGQDVSVRVAIGGRRHIKKTKHMHPIT